MSDLISRRKLLNTFDNKGIQIMFDLPVEEILGEDVDIDDFTMLVQDAIQAYKEMVIDTIKNQPTAYNIDKVVEELEKCECASGAYDRKCWLDKAIEIVKQGGVSDDVCEWNGEQSRLVTFTRFTTACGDNIDLQTNSELLKAFRYCPFCGKKIKIVGD